MNENDESTQHNSRFWFLKPRFKGQHPLEDFDLNGDVVQLLEDLDWFEMDTSGDVEIDPDRYVRLWRYYEEGEEVYNMPGWEDIDYHEGKFYFQERLFDPESGDKFDSDSSPLDVLTIWMKSQEIEESPSEYLRSEGYGSDDWTQSRTFQTRDKLFLKWPHFDDDKLTPIRTSEDYKLNGGRWLEQSIFRDTTIDLSLIDFRDFFMYSMNPNKVLILAVEKLDEQLTAEAVIILSEMLNQGFRAWIEFGYVDGNYSLMPYHEFYLEYLIKRQYEGLFGEVTEYSDSQRALIVRDVLDLYNRLDIEDKPAFVGCLLASDYFIKIGISQDLFSKDTTATNTIDDAITSRDSELTEKPKAS